MMSRKMIILISIIMCLSVFTGISRATDEDLFVTVTTPDALIILDLSGSMAQSPSGDSDKTWANSTCTGIFYSSFGTGHTTSCRKIDIAKRALFDLLDDDNINGITSADVSSLGMRIGFMRYYNCGSSSDAKVYTDSTGCIKLSWGITQADNTTTTPYSSIYCNNTTCASTVTSCTASTPAKECIAGYGTSGGTPLAIALREGKRYLDDHKALDDSRTCRQKSVIIVTDGADTFACGGGGSSTGLAQRRAPVKYAKDLADANYKVYVVGFGSTMAAADIRTLNWMAYYGGTRNPNQTQSAIPGGFSVAANPCSAGSDPGTTANNISGYAFMASDPAELASALKSAISSIQEANYSFSSQASVAAARVQQENFLYEASFEPKNNAGSNKEPFWVGHLKKYELNSVGGLITPACWDAGAKMRDQAATSRNMWTYKGATDKSLVSFTTTNIAAADLGVTTTTRRDEIVGFYRGDATYNLENWKLGDIFHSNPVAVRTPTAYFYDPRQCGATAFNSFQSDTNNQRTAANGKQLILAGANDGQFHAIRAGNSSTDCTAGGDEVWSFIPPNMLQKMSPVAHNSHTDRTTLASHAYFVDGPIEISDVWLPSAASSGTSKAATDWKTIAIFGEGQGSGSYLWSSSSSCYSASTSGFSATYSATYPYYCGYYALNVTNSVTAAQPAYLWHLNPASAQAPYLGEAWSKMQIGRVNIAGNERWVGFIGGGFNNAVCGSSDTCDAADGKGVGKGFFVVDLTDGTILWSYTHLNNANMDFSAPASPLPLDLDNDGFIDTVYMGDMGGNMWRFRLCPRDSNCYSCGLSSYTGSSCTACNTSNWSGSLLYQTTAVERGSGLTPASYSHKQIFTAATATKDASGNVWVYFGTGENNDPTVKPTDTSDTNNRLYGIKENSDFTGVHTTTNLTNITSSSTTYEDTDTKHGWYINLSTNTLTRSDGTTIINPVGEKMISDPTVFGGVVFFSTHVPHQGGGSACGESGDAFLYGIKYTSGGGALENNSRTKYVGHGIGSAPVMSMRPGGSGITDIYTTASGGAGTSALTQKLGNAPSTASMTNILYWKDRRLQ